MGIQNTKITRKTLVSLLTALLKWRGYNLGAKYVEITIHPAAVDGCPVYVAEITYQEP